MQQLLSFESGEREIANELLQNIEIARRQKWTEMVVNLDFKKLSQKAWSLLCKLGGADPPEPRENKISPNNVTSHVVYTLRACGERAHTSKMKKVLKSLRETCARDSECSLDIRIGKITNAQKEIKPCKAPAISM